MSSDEDRIDTGLKRLEAMGDTKLLVVISAWQFQCVLVEAKSSDEVSLLLAAIDSGAAAAAALGKLGVQIRAGVA